MSHLPFLITLSDQRGKIVVLNFWGSWCGPCRYETPILQAIHQRYQAQGVVVVGVTFDDPVEASKAFIQDIGLTYINGADASHAITQDLYQVQGAPENFVIDRQGNIAYFHLGPLTEATLIQVLDELLEKDTDDNA